MSVCLVPNGPWLDPVTDRKRRRICFEDMVPWVITRIQLKESPMFWRIMSPPSSASKIKSIQKVVEAYSNPLLLTSWLASSSVLKMEAISSSDAVDCLRTVGRYNPDTVLFIVIAMIIYKKSTFSSLHWSYSLADYYNNSIH